MFLLCYQLMMCMKQWTPFLKCRGKIVKQDIILSGGKCEINFLEIKYSDESIIPNNIKSMKNQNSVLVHFINQLKLEVK